MVDQGIGKVIARNTFPLRLIDRVNEKENSRVRFW
jgi:hypothetical protein